jgi:arsenate reductase
MSGAATRPLRLLFLCTGNSARSQIAEAVLNQKSHGRFIAGSAGARPAERVNPYAIASLRDHGYEWAGHQPRGLDTIAEQDWDFVITVCDRAKESCPILPGRPVFAHWGMPDPAEVVGTDAVKRRAFDDAFRLINRRIDLLLALPVEKLERRALEHRLSRIGQSDVEAPSSRTEA